MPLNPCSSYLLTYLLTYLFTNVRVALVVGLYSGLLLQTALARPSTQLQGHSRSPTIII